MVCKGYRAILRSHGLKLQYDDAKKASVAWKSYVDEKGRAALILVERKNKKFGVATFRILVLGQGTWKAYFEKEALILGDLLDPFGLVRQFR